MKVTPRLHLNHLEKQLSRVFKSMFDAERNEGGLILSNEENLIAAGDFCCAFNNDPMFSAMVMQLQG